MKIVKYTSLLLFVLALTACDRNRTEDRTEVVTTTPDVVQTEPDMDVVQTEPGVVQTYPSSTVTTDTVSETGILVPRDGSEENSQYYLLAIRKDNDGFIETVNRWVDNNSTGYNSMKIDCQNKKIQELGSSDVSVKDIFHRPGEWYDLPAGTTRADLVNFVCNLSQDELDRINVIDVDETVIR